MSNQKYLPQVIERVKAAKISVSIIATDTGLNERWLREVLNGNIPNAPYEKVMILENYLLAHIATLQRAAQ